MTRPRWRALTDHAARSADPGASAASDRRGPARPSPAPTSASATASQTTDRSGSSATPASPPATSTAPAAAASRSSASAQPTGGEGRYGQDRDQQRRGDRGQSPHLDHEDHDQEQRPDERAREQPERGVRAEVAGAASVRDRLGLRRAPAGGQRGERDRSLKGEDRAPVERLGQQATGRRSERSADGRREAPAACAEHRQCTREQQGAAERLHDAQRDEHLERSRERAAGRAGGEQGQPGVQAEARVSRSDEHQHERRRDHHGDVVGRDHERDALDRGVEIAEKIRQREHDDRRVGEREGHRCPDGGLPELGPGYATHDVQPARAA